MDSWIVAHGSGIDDLLVLGFSSALVLAIRLMIVRHRSPQDPEEPTSESSSVAPVAPPD